MPEIRRMGGWSWLDSMRAVCASGSRVWPTSAGHLAVARRELGVGGLGRERRAVCVGVGDQRRRVAGIERGDEDDGLGHGGRYDGAIGFRVARASAPSRVGVTYARVMQRILLLGLALGACSSTSRTVDGCVLPTNTMALT